MLIRRHLRSQLLHSDGLEVFHRVHYILQLGNCTEDSTLHFHRLYRAYVKGRLTGCSTIFKDNTIESPVIGLAHRRGHAYVRRHAREDKVLDTFVSEEKLKVRVRKGTTAGFVDYRFAGERIQFVNGVMAQFTTNQKTT